MAEKKPDPMKDPDFQRVIHTFLNTPPERKPKQDVPRKRGESKAQKVKAELATGKTRRAVVAKETARATGKTKPAKGGRH